MYQNDSLLSDDLDGMLKRSEVDAKWTLCLRRRFLRALWELWSTVAAESGGEEDADKEVLDTDRGG